MKSSVCKSQADYYDRGAYCACKPYIERKLDILEASIPCLKGKKILDIGCYDGSMVIAFHAVGAQSYGLDISHVALLKAKMKNCLVIENNISDGLAFADKIFDIIYCSEIIEHTLDTDFLLREMYRILKKDGYIFISTPNINALRNRIAILFGHYPFNLEYKLGGAGHIHLYNLKVLINQLKEHKFTIIKKTGINMIPWKLCNKYRILYRINSSLSIFLVSLCLNIAIIGRKITT